LSKKEAALYAGCGSLSAFNDWVRRGILPGPIPRTHKWDRKAIDRALDKASGLEIDSLKELTPLEQWQRDQIARKA
jgi:hypothetical protein